MQGRNKFIILMNLRIFYYNMNKVIDIGFQKKEINNFGEGLYRNEFVIIGKVIRLKFFQLCL